MSQRPVSFKRPGDVARRLSAWQEATVVFALTSGVSLIGHLSSTLPPGYITESRVRRTLVWEIFAGALLLTFLAARRWPVGQAWNAPRWRDVGFALLLLACVAIATVAMLSAKRVIEQVLGVPVLVPTGRMSAGIPNVMLVALVLINPVFEELLWLGYWYQRLEKRSGVLAGTASIGLRAMAHLWKGAFGVVAILPFGLIFTIYFARTRRLWPVILAHAVMDTIAIVGMLQLHH